MRLFRLLVEMEVGLIETLGKESEVFDQLGLDEFHEAVEFELLFD